MDSVEQLLDPTSESFVSTNDTFDYFACFTIDTNGVTPVDPRCLWMIGFVAGVLVTATAFSLLFCMFCCCCIKCTPHKTDKTCDTPTFIRSYSMLNLHPRVPHKISAPLVGPPLYEPPSYSHCYPLPRISLRTDRVPDRAAKLTKDPMKSAPRLSTFSPHGKNTSSSYQTSPESAYGSHHRSGYYSDVCRCDKEEGSVQPLDVSRINAEQIRHSPYYFTDTVAGLRYEASLEEQRNRKQEESLPNSKGVRIRSARMSSETPVPMSINNGRSTVRSFHSIIVNSPGTPEIEYSTVNCGNSVATATPNTSTDTTTNVTSLNNFTHEKSSEQPSDKLSHREIIQEHF